MIIPLSTVYSLRACTLADAAAVAELGNCWSQALMGVNTEAESAYSSIFQAPGFSPAEDTLLVLDQNCRAVGFAEFFDLNEPHVRMMAAAFVHPDHQGCGIGAYLADWLLVRAKACLHRSPEGARVTLTQYLPAQDCAAGALLTAKGFKAVRASYLMRIEMSVPPAAPQSPAGICIRPLCMDTDFEPTVRVVRQSFRDHYGFVEEPFENSIGRWKYITSHDPHFDPALWFVALDGEKICATCYCTPFSEEDPEMGWIQTLGVLREYRGRGLGLALLERAFAEFYRRGMSKVGLSVDAQSLTGATRLYEKAGMRVYRQYHAYEIELRPGVEISTQALG